MSLTSKSRQTGGKVKTSSTMRMYRRKKVDGTWVNYPGYPKYPNNDVLDMRGTQYTESESHAWPPKGGIKGDVGGSFYTTIHSGSLGSCEMSESREFPIITTPYDRQKYGQSYTAFTPCQTVGLSGQLAQPLWPTHLHSPDGEIEAAGATAIARCRPTASATELGVAMGEVKREGFPSIPASRTWQERTLHARNAGSEYLNVKFGWLPLVSEVTSLSETLAWSDHILKQYEADKGKAIRRSYTFPDSIEETTEDLGMASPWAYRTSVGGDTPNVMGKWSKTTTTSIRRWFKGKFVYGVPSSMFPGGAVADLAAKADKLFGLSLTPDLLWNLTPWTWAIDWVTNTDDVLKTASDMATHGLVMQYGYIMETKVTKVAYSLSGAMINGVSVEPAPTVLTVTSKSRHRANPFGFGITWDGLSAAQIAILTALGISRT